MEVGSKRERAGLFLCQTEEILASTIGAQTNSTKISNTFKTERKSLYFNKTISNLKYYFMDGKTMDAFETIEGGRRVHKQLEVDFIINKESKKYYYNEEGSLIMGMKTF